ncbi:MAG TPA: MFS transporter [Polyangia bacterium]|nr:MFS transporter [Polyangia bacterium]
MLLDISPLRRHRDFRLLFVGQFVSFFGSMITYVAIPYQLYKLTGSSLIVGLLGTVQLLPLLLSALWGGAYADAMDRRRLLIGAEALLALTSLGLVVNAHLAHPSVTAIFVLAGLASAVTGFHRPTLEAMSPRLVERHELPATAALTSLRGTLGAVAGPAVGGFCIARLGMTATYLIDVATFVVSLVALARMSAMPAAAEAAKPGLRSIVEGLNYARRRPELIGTYVVDIVAMTFAMPMALFPALAQGWGGATAAGWLYAAMPVGSFVTTVFSGWTQKVSRRGAAVVAAAAAWGIAVVALGHAGNLAAALICLACAGAADMVSGLFRMTIWNETIPTHLRGRLAGVEMISYMTGPLLGNARAGWMASLRSTRFSITTGGWICLAGVLLCIPLLPAFWRYRPEDAQALPEEPLATP